MEHRYWFDNSLSDEGERLRLLEAIADPRSIRLLSEFDIEPGWRCAELGAGAGSMAIWLADQVGTRGSVMAVDRDVTLLKYLSERPNMTILETAIEDLDLPPATLDLIHVRNVLMHIDGADEIIARLVEILRPGGVLLLEEADYFPLAGMTSPAVFEVASALVAKWTWARSMPNTVAQLPVNDIAVSIDTSMLQGGSPEAAFWTYTFRSVEHRLTDPELAASNGLPSVAQATFDEAMSLLADRSFWTPLSAVVCVSCRRRSCSSKPSGLGAPSQPLSSLKETRCRR
jgi:ubiquinone/menaquinone biosynthesis C-methylase UbiE